jgi:hypothetical protein
LREAEQVPKRRFGELDTAFKVRDLVRRITKGQIESLVGLPRYATVISVDIIGRIATVQFPDGSTQDLSFGAVTPNGTVRILGSPKDRYIDDSFGPSPVPLGFLHTATSTASVTTAGTTTYDLVRDDVPGGIIEGRVYRLTLNYFETIFSVTTDWYQPTIYLDNTTTLGVRGFYHPGTGSGRGGGRTFSAHFVANVTDTSQMYAQIFRVTGTGTIQVLGTSVTPIELTLEDLGVYPAGG